MLMLERIQGERAYQVMAERVRVGIIRYHEEFPPNTPRWSWSAGGFGGWYGSGARQGRVETIDEAMRAFRTVWERWVRDAGLIERAYPLDWPPQMGLDGNNAITYKTHIGG